MDYQDLIEEIQEEFPDFCILMKSESLLMRVLNYLLLLVTFGSQKTFMTGYVTTIGQRVYVPEDWEEWEDDRKVAVLRHERVHMGQAEKYTLVLFSLLYAFFPLPLGLAWFRARFEWEAYEETMRAHAEMNGLRALYSPAFKRWIVNQFVTGAYGWMWPFRKTVERWYDNAVDAIALEINDGAQ